MEQVLTLNQRLQVCAFSGELLLVILRRVLSNTGIEQKEIVDKNLFTYLVGYLERLDAKTIVIESNYVDRHFLEDYANYHVRSFSDIGRLCTRLHFFDETAVLPGKRIETGEFFRGSLIDFLKGRSDKITKNSLQAGYLGFTIIRPLRDTFIGRTCLKTYETGDHAGEGSDRKNLVRVFNTTKPAFVNLFGVDLRVEKTLPFQEQDGAVAACASAALWSYFYGTKTSNRRQTPSPSEITKIAQAKGVMSENRLNGAHGLAAQSVQNAITAFDLEYVDYQIADKVRYFKEIIYSYQHLKKEPVLMGVDVLQRNDDGDWEYRASHLVTIVGYAYDKDIFKDPSKFELDDDQNRDFHSVGQSIEKLYCHDDQLGPFAKFVIKSGGANEFTDNDNNYVPPRDEKTGKVTILKPYVGNFARGTENLVADIVYIPRTLHLGVYHKIRNHFGSANDVAMYLDCMLKAATDEVVSREEEASIGAKFWEKAGNISWSVALTDANSYKEKLMKLQTKLGSSRLINDHYDLLVSRLPRFIWCLTCKELGHERFDVLIDATTGDNFSDSEVKADVLDVIYYSHTWKKAINKFSKSLESSLREAGDNNLIRLWRSFTRPKEVNLMLDELYGDPAFPSQIHEHEVRQDFTLLTHENLIKIDAFSYRNDECLVLSKLDKSRTYLWLIDEAGSMYISEQKFITIDGAEKELGHPTLVGGSQARISGELKHSQGSDKTEQNDLWELSNESGRYSIDKSMRNKEQLEGVRKLMQSAAFIESIKQIHIVFDPKFDSQTVTNLARFNELIGIPESDKAKNSEKTVDIKFDLIQQVVFMLEGGTDEQTIEHILKMLNDMILYITKSYPDIGIERARVAITSVQCMCNFLVDDYIELLSAQDLSSTIQAVESLSNLRDAEEDYYFKNTMIGIRSLLNDAWHINH